MSTEKKKVFVGMSGGVDSSVSALLLKEAGYDVTGVFIKVWQPDWITCTATEDRLDAMRVCAHIGIPFKTLNLEDVYKKEVVDYMVNEYKSGRTPNPDVFCNKEVKFGAFLEWALSHGADYVATGHYAEVTNRDGVYNLSMGLDQNKDQSYFLWTLTQEKLSRILFPVGGIEKTEVRRIAEQNGLITAEKKDSQGLCFVGKIDLKEFLSHFVMQEKGNVYNTDGEVIGVHDGAMFYTIGQRHGFTITRKTPTDVPYFIIRKDVERNSITVSHKDEEGMLPDSRSEITIENVNWIQGGAPKESLSVSVRFRYRQELYTASVTPHDDGTATVRFTYPVSSIPSGQSLVMYSGTTLIGGGIVM